MAFKMIEAKARRTRSMGQCRRSDTNLSSSLLSMVKSQRHASWLPV
jgi:hypothetical protein